MNMILTQTPSTAILLARENAQLREQVSKLKRTLAESAEAVQAGYDAGLQNQPRSRNPFPQGDVLAQSWAQGWQGGHFQHDAALAESLVNLVKDVVLEPHDPDRSAERVLELLQKKNAVVAAVRRDPDPTPSEVTALAALDARKE